jgi:hypothetical protein
VDETQRMDGGPPPAKVITLPPKERVNIALAVVAGALTVLVVISAHDALASRLAAPAPPAPTATASPAPTDAAPAAPHGKPPKGKGHD